MTGECSLGQRPGSSIELDICDDVAVLKLRGELDVTSAPGLKETLERVIDEGSPRVVVDAAKVTYMDSAALGVLICSDRRLRGRGGQFAIACEAPLVRRVFHVTGLDGFLSVHESRAAAMRAVVTPR